MNMLKKLIVIMIVIVIKNKKRTYKQIQVIRPFQNRNFKVKKYGRQPWIQSFDNKIAS
jgi:hypothetical protein